jgi:NTP pyrophosphatase (non-canonical NTP hydrolase)
MGTGQEQYSRADHQAFEDMSVSRIIDETLDELADIVNYSTFLAITLQRLKQKLEEAL